jgi:hypothetical protein
MAHVSVIAANARAARYSLFPIASTHATPPAMTAKSKSSDAAHRDGMEIRVTPGEPRGTTAAHCGLADRSRGKGSIDWREVSHWNAQVFSGCETSGGLGGRR